MCQGLPSLAQERIKAKYVTKFKNGSQIQQSIGNAWSILKTSCWNLCDEKIASFWYDNWLGSGPLRGLVLGPLTKRDDEITVYEVRNNGAWNGGNLLMNIQEPVLDRIFSHVWPPTDTMDKPYSSLVPHNSFSLKQAYNLVLSTRRWEGSINLLWIWQGKHPPN